MLAHIAQRNKPRERRFLMSLTLHKYQSCKHLSRAACFLVLVGAFSALNAQCPPTDHTGWPRGSTITSHLDPNMPDAEQAQTRSAMTKWNNANQTNGSGVSFREVLNPGQIPSGLEFSKWVTPNHQRGWYNQLRHWFHKFRVGCKWQCKLCHDNNRSESQGGHKYDSRNTGT